MHLPEEFSLPGEPPQGARILSLLEPSVGIGDPVRA
jgi:hypothetical protein